MTLGKRKRLAEIVMGGEWFIDHGHVWSKEFAGETSLAPLEWFPSIAPHAQDWQLAQACRVIVAAFNIPGFVGLERHIDLAIIKCYANGTMLYKFCGNDLLEAASMALLGRGKE